MTRRDGGYILSTTAIGTAYTHNKLYMATEPRRKKMKRTAERIISERVASLPLERQIRIASSYPKFGTVANAARVVDTQPKRKVLK